MKIGGTTNADLEHCEICDGLGECESQPLKHPSKNKYAKGRYRSQEYRRYIGLEEVQEVEAE